MTWRDIALALLRHRQFMIGFVIMAVIVVLGFFGPLISDVDPLRVNATQAFQPPSAAFLFGTDHLGRDIFTRVMYGAGISIQIGVVATVVAALFGVVLGLLAGYLGGWTDSIISRVIDVLLAFPGILLALIAVALLGPGLLNTMIAVGLGRVPQFARLVRGQVLSVREFDFVLGARALGANDVVIMLRHILPNVMAPIIVFATLGVGTAILAAAALGYLGLGAQPPTPEWGAMLARSREFLRFAWWMTTFPGLAIMVTVIAMNLVGDGLRDVLDPRVGTR